MAHPASRKLETRESILKSARHLFNRRGFAEVTIDEIMAHAGLTRGGFYKHFNTKEELYAEAITQFACDGPEAWQAAYIDPAAPGSELAKMIIHAYLSKEHLEDRDGSCPLIGLPSDAARSGEAVKGAYCKILEMMTGAFEASLPPGQATPRRRALAVVALCVGSMVLSRAIGDRSLADDLRHSARDHALGELGLREGSWPWPTRAPDQHSTSGPGLLQTEIPSA
jgi:TetR/AcrR family transcriptional regulator, transcriptional repressor for nem operon